MDNMTNPNTGISSPTISKNRQKNKYLIPMIILAVIALGGICFGIFGMVMNGKSNQETKDLRADLEQKTEALNLAEEKLGAKIEVEPETQTPDEEPSSSNNANISASRNYIYVGEWGIKIQVPEELKSVSYNFIGGKDYLYVSGITCGNGQCQYYPQFLEDAVMNGSGLGALARYSKNDGTYTPQTENGVKILVHNGISVGTVVYEDDTYYIVYGHPNGIFGTGEEQEWARSSIDLIEDMLTHSISAF